jgi:hypothetical protein
MKKFILITIAIMSMAFVQAQTLSQITTGTIDGPTYTTFWGHATVDTLGASDTLTLTIRVKGDYAQQVDQGLYVTKISGTVTNNFFIQGSMDGVTFFNVDTIANSNVSTGMKYNTMRGWNYPYMRFRAISGATAQKAWYKLWWLNRYCF